MMIKSIFIFGIFCMIVNVSEGIKVTQPDVVVASRHGKATLICGYKINGNVEEVRFSLLKKKHKHVKEICAFSFTTNYEPVTTRGTIQCEGEPGPNNVTFRILGLQKEDTGIYMCKLEVMYPPPYRSTEGNATLIYVSDLLSECEQSAEPLESIFSHRLFIAVFLAILLYSLFITGVLLFKKQRKRRWDVGFYEKMLELDPENKYFPYYIETK